MSTIEQRAHEWIVGDDTGVSSKTIWSVMMNVVPDKPGPFQFDIPHDPDDFGRCYRLLKLIPEWRAKLHLVAERFPIWGPMVATWSELELLYERDQYKAASPELYARMRTLIDDGRLAAGWKRTGPNSWNGPRASVVELHDGAIKVESPTA